MSEWLNFGAFAVLWHGCMYCGRGRENMFRNPDFMPIGWIFNFGEELAGLRRRYGDVFFVRVVWMDELLNY
jgi:hypothetical protein